MRHFRCNMKDILSRSAVREQSFWESPPDKFEVYNDRNQNLVNLFRCMRERPMALIQELGFLTLNSRDDFRILKTFFRACLKSPDK